MKKLLLTALCIAASQFIFSQRISIQPSVLDFRLGTAGNQAQVVRISNLSDKKVTFHAYLADWLRDSTGGHQYFKPDTLQRSCASWVQLNKEFIEVSPGTTEELIVRLNTPNNEQQLKQMKWAMLFIQSADEKNGADGKSKQMETQVKEILRVGVHIYETPPSLVSKSVQAISFKPLKEKNSYEVLLKNTGDVMVQCKSYIELTDPSTGISYKTENLEFPVFPEGVRKLKFELPANIPKGKYSALAIIDMGEDAPLEGMERTIEIL